MDNEGIGTIEGGKLVNIGFEGADAGEGAEGPALIVLILLPVGRVRLNCCFEGLDVLALEAEALDGGGGT